MRLSFQWFLGVRGECLGWCFGCVLGGGVVHMGTIRVVGQADVRHGWRLKICGGSCTGRGGGCAAVVVRLK